MQHTQALHVVHVTGRDDRRVAIHPNDGFDIGLMTTSYDVSILSGSNARDFEANDEALPGHIDLKNECRNGTIEMTQKLWERLGSPENVLLVHRGESLLLVNPDKD